MIKNCLIRKYPLVYPDSFDINFWRYLSFKEKTKENTETINKIVYDRILPVKDTWNTYRVINHWMSKWLIDDNRNSEKWWRKFDLREIIWISVISKLREFDFSINKILEVKKYLFEFDNIFEFYLMRAYSQKEEIKVIIFENWEASLVSEIELEITRDFIKTENFIQISFTSLLEQLLKKKIERKDINNISLSNREYKLFAQMYDNVDSDFQIKTENWRIKKFKQIKNKKQKIWDIKNINLRELVKNNKNSKICIYTNSDWNITDIELAKESD
jgi:DNA-binding transcriptional MerR regulator